MKVTKHIGGLEEIVLLTVHALGDEAYGVTIHDALHHAGRNISIGSLYTTLGRLEDKRYLASTDKSPSAERGDRPKRYFKLTGQGVKAINEASATRSSIASLAGGVLPWNA